MINFYTTDSMTTQPTRVIMFLSLHVKERDNAMAVSIDSVKTGQQLRLLMEERGISVKDVKNALYLSCVQSVYHWLDGSSMPSLDNLYALSELLKVPMDLIVCGNRKYNPGMAVPIAIDRLWCYYKLIQDCMAA